MGVWMDGWVGGWVDGCVGGWIDGWIEKGVRPGATESGNICKTNAIIKQHHTYCTGCTVVQFAKHQNVCANSCTGWTRSAPIKGQILL